MNAFVVNTMAASGRTASISSGGKRELDFRSCGWRAALVCGLAWGTWTARVAGAPEPLWEEAKRQAPIHRFSVLFDIQDVTNVLSNDQGLNEAIGWCQSNGATKVFIETFRNDYQAESNVLVRAKQRFLEAGFEVAASVSTEKVGLPSLAGHRNPPCLLESLVATNATESCYTDPQTQTNLAGIFSFAANLFDELIIDDYWFTECVCEECDNQRLSNTIELAGQRYAPAGDSWQTYRREKMLRLSENFILRSATNANPKVKVILKFPNWYDKYQFRGYDVLRQTDVFDRIWVGTETRNINDPTYGGIPQYSGYFLMRWLAGVGGPKTGGGWYDWIACSPATYLEQARQTVLGGARESVLFCYGGMRLSGSEEVVSVLRANLPELWKVADQVRQRRPVGVAAFKPVNSDPCTEIDVFGFVGMLGIPLQPCHEFPSEAPAAFFSYHALSSPNFAQALAGYIQTGKPVLLTDGLQAALGDLAGLAAPNVRVLRVQGSPRSLLDWSAEQVAAVRDPLVEALGASFAAPANVALYLFDDGSSVIENFLDQPAQVTLNGHPRTVEPRGWLCDWRL